MAEPKRIQLDAPKSLQREKKSKALPPTYRFELKLSGTKLSYAEYSYTELVKEARVPENDSKRSRTGDPFSLDDDDDRKLKEIAQKFEEKYNPKPGRKKRKKMAVSEDYIDKGMGYDETDPFIDNEEAYDELVPSTLTTQYGGFYINKGDLEFRYLSEADGFESKVKKKRLKGFDKEGRKRRRFGDENQKRRGRRPADDSSSALMKPPKKSQLTVADMLQQHKAKLQLMQQESLQVMELNPISVEREMETEEVKESEAPAPVTPSPTPAPTSAACSGSTISEAIESVVKAAAEDLSNGSMGPVTGSSDGEEIKPPVENVEAPKLPDNLPSDLNDVVIKLKEAAYKSEEGKCKFFSDDVNRMLLSVELKAQALTSAQRSNIYAHLASHLPCTKETLQKRAKKLRLDQEDGKLREPMKKLRDSIAAVMPLMMEKYEELLKSCNSREEEKKSENAAASEGEDSQGEKKVSRLPRKHFEWNDEIRKQLCDVVRIKLKCYEVSKTRNQSAEEYLKHFLEAEVKNLWPPGWMQSRILFRESRAAHMYITNRPKKQILLQKKAVNPVVPPAHPTKSAPVVNNSLVTQDSESDQVFLEKSVPLIPPVENALEKRENLELLAPNNGFSHEERAAEFAKLFKLPILSTVPDDLSSSVNQECVANQVTTQATVNKVTVETPSTQTSILNTVADLMLPVKSTLPKSDKVSRHNQQNKQSFASKVADFAAFSEGSHASDMLARIICASLADYPYAGSQNVESASKTTGLISPVLSKEIASLNPKLPSEIHTSPKKLESAKTFNSEKRKTSQENMHLSNLGLTLEAHNAKTNTPRHDSSIIVKNKSLPNENSTAVNLKLKDTLPHARQFAEAFEKIDVFPFNKKHSTKGAHVPGSPVGASSSRFHNSSELLNDYPTSTSPRALESAQRLAFEMAKYSSQGSATPYKKRTKYSSSKMNDQWSQLHDTNLGSSLLEGMKGFPYPVSLPTPPPAHSSSPHRTVAHSQHNSRTTTHISSGLRNIHESKSEVSNHNSQTHSSIIPVSDAQRRQSLIQGPWKSNTSQASTSLTHFMANTSPPLSNQCKSTSPNHHTSNSHIKSPVPAHSMPQIDKVSTPYSRSHSPLPPLASPSHLSTLGHLSKSPVSSYSHLGQASFTTHQSSQPVSQAIPQLALARANNIFESPNTALPSTSTHNINQEQKASNPRTN